MRNDTKFIYSLSQKNRYNTESRNKRRSGLFYMAIQYKFLTIPLLLLIISCNNTDKEKEADQANAETDINIATSFIRTTLDGNYDKARNYILADSVNNNYIDVYERAYKEKMNPDDKRSYRESTIRIIDNIKQNDSVTLITYSNSFKDMPTKLKVIKQNNKWLIDFKYTVQPDTLPKLPIKPGN
jgi:Domain of unknown function (DUF4878)